MIDRHPPGTTFCLAAGRYHPSSLTPLTGDIIDGSDRAAVFDGMNRIRHAIVGSRLGPNVTIRGLTIENYDSPLQTGALQAFGTSGWVIENNHVTRNAAAGITVDGGAKVLNNLLDYNTQEGFACHGKNDLFEGNEIAYNNLHMTVDWNWEAGGGKCWATEDLQMVGNYSHNNGGPGLWTDTNNVYTSYAFNTVVNNYGPGILHEISYSATIVKNLVSGNGLGDHGGSLWDAGILLSSSGGQDSSDPIVVSGNTVIDNYNAIGITQQSRGSGSLGRHSSRNILVYSNHITMSRGAVGITGVNNRLLRSLNISFTANSYLVTNVNGTWFAWENDLHTWPEWKRYGNDAMGTLTAARKQ